MINLTLIELLGVIWKELRFMIIARFSIFYLWFAYKYY